MSEFSTRYLADYRPSDFLIKTVNLTVFLDDNSTKVINEMKVVKNNDEAEQLVLDGEHLQLISIEVDGLPVAEQHYQVTNNALQIDIKKPEFTLKITTEIDPENNTALEGLYKSGQAFCTQCEAEGFRRITYYLDRPDIMAIFTTKIIANKALYPFLLSNGNKVDSGDYSQEQHFVTWHDPFPKPAYLFALVAGDFDVLTDSYQTTSGRDVALEIFVDKGNIGKAHHAMDSLKKSMQWDEQTFGLEYDLDIYMIVAVDFFNMGAMENKGLNIFNSKYVLADKQSATDTDYFNIEAVIAHEYFHNWTGNRVTCRDWFQLSLKEGLTVFRDQQFSADMHSAAVTRIQNVKVLRAQQFAEDASPMSHPIRPEKVMEMNNFYTLTVYEKGAEVIRMIHTLLGKEGFRKGMDLYFKRYDGMAVTCDDFVNAMADATGKDLSLFKRWYSQSGTPELQVAQSWDASQGQFSLTISQHHTPTESQPNKQCLHIPVRVELIHESGTIEKHLLELTDASNTWHFAADAKPTIAMLADFSAPVKVRFNQSHEELATIIAIAEDYFCRWDAMQKTMQHYIKALTENIESVVPDSFFELLTKNITSVKDDAFKALLLTLPSFDELVSEIEQVDAIALYKALQSLKEQISKRLSTELESCYQQCIAKEGLSSSEQVANKSLMNVCLSYLLVQQQYQSLANDQYQQAQDMTVEMGALSAAVRANITDCHTMIADFEQRWVDNTLVMDKWYSLSASVDNENMIEHLQQLMARSDFSLKNPNRTRALIGAFSAMNPKHFHHSSGEGYKFLADQIIQLNDINPQVASRLITPLIQFKEFDLSRQHLMKEELQRIKSMPNLARDLVEKLEAALS